MVVVEVCSYRCCCLNKCFELKVNSPDCQLYAIMCSYCSDCLKFDCVHSFDGNGSQSGSQQNSGILYFAFCYSINYYYSLCCTARNVTRL